MLPASREKESAHMLQLVLLFLQSTRTVWVPTSARHSQGTPTKVTPFS